MEGFSMTPPTLPYRPMATCEGQTRGQDSEIHFFLMLTHYWRRQCATYSDTTHPFSRVTYCQPVNPIWASIMSGLWAGQYIRPCIWTWGLGATLHTHSHSAMSKHERWLTLNPEPSVNPFPGNNGLGRVCFTRLIKPHYDSTPKLMSYGLTCFIHHKPHKQMWWKTGDAL